MAASVVQLSSFAEIAPMNLSSDLRAAKLLCQKDEKLYEESPSTFSEVSSETCNSRIESQSLNNDYDSWSSISEQKRTKCNKNGKIMDGDSAHSKASNDSQISSARMPVIRKSRVSSYLTATESGTSDLEQGSVDRSAATCRDKLTDCLPDLRGKMITSGSDVFAQNRGDSLDCSIFSYNNSKTSFQHETDDNQKYDRNKQLSLSDLESRSQNSDFANTKQTYTFNSKPAGGFERNGLDAIPSRTTVSSVRHSNHNLHFNVSELTLKLRGSMESEFLSNELRKHDVPKLEYANVDSSDTCRTVDEILRHYGFASEVSSSQYKNAAYNNVSQNNEASHVLETSGSGRKEKTISSRPREAVSQSMTQSKTNMNAPARKASQVNSSSYLDTKNLTGSGVRYRTNLSQNNETKYAIAHQDLLRKYGSSVDYSSIAAGGKYSTTPSTTNYGRYDYGKLTTLSGDVVAGTNTAYTNTNGQDFEVKRSNMLTRQLEGSQVDILKPADMMASKGDDYNTLRHTGSSIDAVEFTLTSERQRLRRLNNMITSTSVTTSDATAHKNLMTRYLSPQRDYDSLRASKAVNKAYSSPTFPSAHYGTSLTPKSSWVGNMGQRDTSIFMGKSASVPSTWNNGFQSVTNYSTSVDSRSPYLPYYSSRDHDIQFNNSTCRSFSLERLATQMNSSKNHSRPIQYRKPDTSLRNKLKQNILMPTQHKSQSRCPLKNTSNISMFSSPKSDGSYSSKSGSRKTACTKKTANRNMNDSKSTSNNYGGFDVLKNLNKSPWQENQFTKTTVATSGHWPCGSNCSQHPSHAPGQVRKVETFYNLAKELFTNEGLQAPSKSKHTRQANRKINSSGGGNPRKIQGRGRESEAVPSRKSREQGSVHSSHNFHETNKRILRQVQKNRERIASEILIQKTTAMPKSIQKHRNHIPGTMACVTRPHSALAASSRSYPEFSTRLPYQVNRDFSTSNFYSNGPSYY